PNSVVIRIDARSGDRSILYSKKEMNLEDVVDASQYVSIEEFQGLPEEDDKKNDSPENKLGSDREQIVPFRHVYNRRNWHYSPRYRHSYRHSYDYRNPLRKYYGRRHFNLRPYNYYYPRYNNNYFLTYPYVPYFTYRVGPYFYNYYRRW
ncbi:MAG: hypothetical protein KDD61_02405, partial [Bdellovibrionales bacterium]|nr:hypothetical protein [Bdellovibrionales bacterium]